VLYGDVGNDVMVIDGVEDHAHGGDGIDTLVVSSKVGVVINLASGYIDANPYTSPGDWYNNPHFNLYGPFGPGGPFPHAPGDTPQVTDVENVIGSNFSDKIIGTDGANSLLGQDGDDVLMGRAGDDHLEGGNGNDFLFGGTGADTLTGGQGADMFVWTAVNDSLMAGGKPQDVVTDFQPGSDKIDLSAFNVGLNDLVEIDNQTIDGVSYSYVGVDANHNGQLDQGEFAIAVKMAPGTVLHANDFLF
jgi:Ca2+-binding RTX toxin-like protein